MKVLFAVVGIGLPPMGLLYLIPPIEKAGYTDIELISLQKNAAEYERSWQRLDDILKKKPKLVGITSTSPMLMDAVEVARRAKKAGAFTIIGGPGPTSSGKAILEKFPEVDMVYKGEAENTILKIVKKIDKGDFDFSGVPGAVWHKGKKIIDNGKNPLIMDLNSLDFPDRKRLSFSTLHGSFSIVTQRGCPYDCAFCFKPIHGRVFRSRTPENVVTEIKQFINEFPKEFEAENRQVVIADDIFNLDLKRAKAVLDAIIKAKLNITLVCVNGFHAKTVDLELFQKYKKAGGKVLWFGADAGSEKILKNLGKHVTLDEIRNAVVLAKKAGIETVGIHFIIGLEDETPETAQETIDFAASLPVDEIGFNHANVLPGTRLWDYATTHGKLLFETDGLDLSKFPTGSPVAKFETPEFTKEQREEAFEKAVVLMDKVRRRSTLKPKKIIGFILGIKSFGDLVWAIGRVKTFLFAKNLRLAQKKPKPSKLKTTMRNWSEKKENTKRPAKV